jgi:hypothetical protein
MGRKISPADMQVLLQGLREHVHRSLLADVRELICALQQRHLPEARRIAGQLPRDLALCDRLQAQYFISRIVSLLADENVFDRCDQLSAWLLFLERELESVAELTSVDRSDAALDSHCADLIFAPAEPNVGCDPVISVHAGQIAKEGI